MPSHSVAIVCVVLGLLAIVTRGPLFFAPATTVRAYRWVVASTRRVRVLGVLVCALGLWMVAAASGDDSTVGKIVLVLGWPIAAVGCVLLLVFPDTYRRLAEGFFSTADTALGLAMMRMLGLAGLSIGAVVLYFGVGAL